MKKIKLLSIMLLLFLFTVAGTRVTIEGPKTCKLCGMYRDAFAHSRMLILYEDGTTVGVCSLHCAAEELHKNRDKRISSIKVADYSSKKLIDATTATWVVGGRKAGVMTAVAKWAFASATDARRFVDENGGIVNSYGQATATATREVMDLAAEETAVKKELYGAR